MEKRSIDDGPVEHRFHDRYNLVSASVYDRHTIVGVVPRTLTLALMGPKVREWGFHSPDGWIHWKDYYTAQRAERNKAKTDSVAK